MKQYKFLSLCMIFLLIFQGCSALKSNTQTISVLCKPPDITLKINGDRYECPAKLDVRRNRTILIEASKEGCEPYKKMVDYHFSASGIADVVGTALIFFPVFGLLFPGAWDLDQTEFNVELCPLPVKKTEK